MYDQIKFWTSHISIKNCIFRILLILMCLKVVFLCHIKKLLMDLYDISKSVVKLFNYMERQWTKDLSYSNYFVNIT